MKSFASCWVAQPPFAGWSEAEKGPLVIIAWRAGQARVCVPSCPTWFSVDLQWGIRSFLVLCGAVGPSARLAPHVAGSMWGGRKIVIGLCLETAQWGSYQPFICCLPGSVRLAGSSLLGFSQGCPLAWSGWTSVVTLPQPIWVGKDGSNLTGLILESERTPVGNFVLCL